MYTLPVSANAINAPAASAPLPIIGMDHSSNVTDRKRSVRMNNGDNLQKGYLVNEHSWYLTIQPNRTVMAARGPNPIYGLLMIHLVYNVSVPNSSPSAPFGPIKGPSQPQKRSSKHPPHVIKGVKTGLYLCIDKKAKVYSSLTLTEECHIYLENDTTNEIDQFYRKGLPTDKINIKRCPRKFKRQYKKKRPYRLYIGIHNKGRIMRGCKAGPYGSKRRNTSSPKSSRFQIVWEPTPPSGPFATIGAIRPTEEPGPVGPFDNAAPKDKTRKPGKKSWKKTRRQSKNGRKKKRKPCVGGLSSNEPFRRAKCGRNRERRRRRKQ